MSSLTMNGGATGSPRSLSESEESFVVLSPSLAPDNMENIMSINASMVNSTVASSMPEVSKEMSQAISAMSVSATSELSPDEIHSKLESLLHENLQLKETLHQNNLAMKKQFTTLVTWQEDVMKVHQSHKEKFEETKKLISNLRAENTELKKGSSLPPDLPQVDETEKLNLKSKISALEFELDTLRQGYMKSQSEQTAKIDELQSKVTQLEKEKDDQMTILNAQITSLKYDLEKTQEKLIVAQKRVVDLADKVPTISSLETIEKLNRELLEMSADLEYKNKTLNEKMDEVDKLTEENKKLETENQTIPIYKTQVEVYQKDFNAERDARNALHEEKEKIATDLRHLQRRNQELMEQVERLSHNDGNFVHVEAPSARGGFASSREVSQFSCPKCNFGFRNYQALENHVYRCIELDDQIP